MAGISPISGAGAGAYNAYFHPAMNKINMPHKAGLDPSNPVSLTKPVPALPESGKAVAGWAINSFKSILNFFSDTHSMKKDDVSEIQVQCPTCCNREYTCSNGETSDGKSTMISGHESAERVRQHEAEHLRIARTNAAAQGKMVVAQQINMIAGKCPECGETYVAKGEAITQTVEIITAKQLWVTASATDNPSRNYPHGGNLRSQGIGRLFDGYG